MWPRVQGSGFSNSAAWIAVFRGWRAWYIFREWSLWGNGGKQSLRVRSIMAVLGTNLKIEPLAEGQSAAVVVEDPGRPSIAAKMPRKPAPNVAELSARLFAAYAIDGGSIRLAGCTLEPVPIVHGE